MSKITKIYQNNNPNEKYDFGTTFDNVSYDYEENNNQRSFSLTKLLNYLKDFFDKGTFVMYSSKEPLDTRVKVWYQTRQN